MPKQTVNLLHAETESTSPRPSRPFSHYLLRLLCLVILVLLFPFPGLGQGLIQEDFSLQNDAALPWTLEADQVESLQKDQILEAHGDVLIRQGENSIRSDKATYFRDTGFAHLAGNVRIEWDGDILTGDTADFDLRNSVGWVTDGEIFMVKEHFYIQGKLLEKTCENTYAFKDGRITTCDGPVPAWSLKSSEGEVTTGGYARMWHPRFQVKNKPVVYSPYMIFPVKTERQSGFLIPEPSYSTRLGVGLNVPYYWAINEEQDATFYANMMSKRGVMTGAEYRHFTNLDSKGVWRADWLYDREIAATEEEESAQFRGDGLTRSNRHRYWIRGKHDGFLGDPSWRTKIDLDLVSDQNYLREFKNGYSGYQRTHDQMLADFGRGMNNIDRIIRSNVFELSRNWTRLGFRGSLQYYQHLAYWTDNRSSKEDPTLQRLPEMNLDFYKTRIGSTPFELEARNQAVYFWREYGTTGARTDFEPKLSLPWVTRFGTLTPSAAWRQTFYVIDRHQNSPEEVDASKDFFERGIPEYRVDAFSSLFKIFDLGVQEKIAPTLENVGNRHWSKIKHTFQPEFAYSYIPELDQTGKPYFDRTDRIQKRNRLSYLLLNVLDRRLDQVVQRDVQKIPENDVPEDDANGKEFSIGTSKDYLEFFRLRLDQYYDFDEAERDIDLERYPRRPFSDIRAEASINPGKYVTLWNRTWYSPYLNEITEHEHLLEAGYDGLGSAYFGVDFRSEVDDAWRRNQRKREILRVGGLLHLPRGWTVRADYKTDLNEKEDLEKIFGLGYTHQCYFVELIFSQTPDEDRYEVRFSLKGLEALSGLSQ
jgi:LPS-assembly protein